VAVAEVEAIMEKVVVVVLEAIGTAMTMRLLAVAEVQKHPLQLQVAILTA
jgi:hypothetical protein